MCLYYIPVSPNWNAFENGMLMLSGRAPRLNSLVDRTSITIILDLVIRPTLNEDSSIGLIDELLWAFDELA